MTRSKLTAALLAAAAAAAATFAFAAPAAHAKSPYDDVADSLIQRFTHQREQDPLKFLAGDMGDITTDLSAYKTDQPVQRKQEQVVGRLDELIKLLEQQCKSGAGGGGGNPTRPLQRSILASGPGGQGDMHDPKQGEKQWGQLPPKQREQIVQSKTEGFPPGFESMLQSYYERLAAEQVTGAAAEKDAAAPAAGGGGQSAPSPASTPVSPARTPAPAGR